jgi:hypothetical protein
LRPRGDVNGDGYADILVGTDLWARVYLYRLTVGARVAAGVCNGVPPTVGSIRASPASAGDVNGTVYSDVLVGSPANRRWAVVQRRSVALLGSPSGLSVAASWSDRDYTTTRTSVSRVATAGDVNADGYSDVIVGAPFDNDHAIFHRASLRVTSAGFGDFCPRHSQTGSTLPTRRVYNYLGLSLGTDGDDDGDGYSDVLIGSHVLRRDFAECRAGDDLTSARARVWGSNPAWTQVLANLDERRVREIDRGCSGTSTRTGSRTL